TPTAPPPRSIRVRPHDDTACRTQPPVRCPHATDSRTPFCIREVVHETRQECCAPAHRNTNENDADEQNTQLRTDEKQRIPTDPEHCTETCRLFATVPIRQRPDARLCESLDDEIRRKQYAGKRHRIAVIHD